MARAFVSLAALGNYKTRPLLSIRDWSESARVVLTHKPAHMFPKEDGAHEVANIGKRAREGRSVGMETAFHQTRLHLTYV